MAKRLDLTNDVYGDFTVVEMLYGYKYISNKPRTYCRCLGVDGKEYIIRADALRTGATKHIKGAEHKVVFKDLTNMKFGHLTALYPTGKKASNGTVIWHCQCDCGSSIDVPSGNLLRGHTRSCGHKHRSKYEDFIYDYLKSINIDFETEYRFQDCTNANGTVTLPFDFYLYKLNKIIEFDGQQHYMPIDGCGGEEKFRTTQENDSIKNRYCKENNIDLLRIPYTTSENDIIKLINSFLSPVTITVV